MKTTICALAIGLGSTVSAQVAEKIWAEPAELKALARRILVVELPEENPKVIDGFSKKTAESDIAAYRASLASYRALIEPAVRAHWKYNEQIEFRTTSEIIALFAKKSTKHVAMLKVVLADGMDVNAYTFGLGCPALVLTRTDGDSKVSKKGQLNLIKHDYQMYLATTASETGEEAYSAERLMFTLTQAQKHIDWIIKTGKSQSFVKYCKAMAEANCPKLHGMEMIVPEDGLFKDMTQDEARTYYTQPMSFVSHADLDAAYATKAKGKAVLYSLPVGTISGSMIIVTVTHLAYMKVFVDPVTNEIVNATIPGQMGVPICEGLHKVDLRNLNECD